MSRLNSHRLFAVLVIVFIGWGQVDARPFRVSQLPNGSMIGCAACHVNPAGGGARTPFGNDINNNYLVPSGRTGNVQWNAMLAMLDSDGDGVSNGQELGDPDGDGTVDPGIQVTNPGDPNSFMQMPSPGGAPSATSVVIGGVTIGEDMVNPIVPSGMQTLEITFDKPLVVTVDPTEGVGIENVELLVFPIALLETATDLAVSDDRMKVTVNVTLSENAAYQMVISSPNTMAIALMPLQQYFFGTVELSDAVVSGVGILPEGFALSGEPGGATLMDPELYLKALESVDIDLFLRAVVRIANFNEQLAFELKHVPDGTYVLSLSQDVVDADGNVVTMSHLSGINPFTGRVDPATLIQVADGASVTDLQIMLQTEPEPLEINGVSVQSVDVENNSFSIQLNDQQVRVDVSQALMINLGQRNPEEILSIFFSGNVDDLAQLFFSITDLMAGDIVSILEFPSSTKTIQALMVIRHQRSADLNGDGNVDFSDFLLFVAAFGKSEGEAGYNAAADLDGDGTVAFSDFLIFASAFGKPVG